MTDELAGHYRRRALIDPTDAGAWARWRNALILSHDPALVASRTRDEALRLCTWLGRLQARAQRIANAQAANEEIEVSEDEGDTAERHYAMRRRFGWVRDKLERTMDQVARRVRRLVHHEGLRKLQEEHNIVASPELISAAPGGARGNHTTAGVSYVWEEAGQERFMRAESRGEAPSPIFLPPLISAEMAQAVEAAAQAWLAQHPEVQPGFTGPRAMPIVPIPNTLGPGLSPADVPPDVIADPERLMRAVLNVTCRECTAQVGEGCRHDPVLVPHMVREGHRPWHGLHACRLSDLDKHPGTTSTGWPNDAAARHVVEHFACPFCARGMGMHCLTVTQSIRGTHAARLMVDPQGWLFRDYG